MPTIRRYMFNEQEEVKLVTETEQNLIWTCVVFPVLSVGYSCCQRISAFVLSHPRIAQKIVEYTSIGWACQKIRQRFFGQTLIPMLKRAAIDPSYLFLAVQDGKEEKGGGSELVMLTRNDGVSCLLISAE